MRPARFAVLLALCVGSAFAAPLQDRPARTRADVEAAMQRFDADPNSLDPLTVVLVATGNDGVRDYQAWQNFWAQLLRTSPGVTVETAAGFPSQDQLQRAHLVVFFRGPGGYSPDEQPLIADFLRRNRGMVFLNTALRPNNPQWFYERGGGAFVNGESQSRLGSFEVRFAEDDLTVGLTALPFYDEMLWDLRMDDRAGVIATAEIDGQARPVAWKFEGAGGRVFSCVVGHQKASFDDPMLRMFVLRGMAWAARQNPYRFEHLTLLAAQVSE